MKPLTVYKASAGSGKTFTLTIEYIKLLMADPLSFKKILAVTFTNKATEEMKIRILSQLYGIWKGLPDSESYIAEITEKLGIGRQQASRQAGIALNFLLHNYNYFRVETIDTFFQSILRNLARELDLTANLRIDLNDGEVEEQAVDRMIESLDAQSVVLKWIISYIMSTIDENKSWNVIGQIKSFGNTIFK
ncbi:MAG: UvrD-helicase domain-containing protein, partial [Prevotella sp.]|nr:UvrD-helicase domain-containing protein [Prevotella sp.]